MKSFKQHISQDNWLVEETIALQQSVLNEAVSAKWVQSSFLNMLAGNILISDAIYKRIGEEALTGDVFHTTSKSRIASLASIQKKRNTSVSSRLAYAPGNGVWEKGYVTKLYGDLLFASGRDIMSIPDEQGRRWVSFINVASEFHYGNNNVKHNYSWFEDQHKRFLTMMGKELIKLFPVSPNLDPKENFENSGVHRLINYMTSSPYIRKNNTSSLENTNKNIQGYLSSKIPDAEHSWEVVRKKAGKILQKYVSAYIKLSHKILSRYIESIKDGMVSYKQDRWTSTEGEVLVSNFRIKEVMIIEWKYASLDIVQSLKKHFEIIKRAVPKARVFWYDNGNYDFEQREILRKYFEFKQDFGEDIIFEVDDYAGQLFLDENNDFEDTTDMS